MSLSVNGTPSLSATITVPPKGEWWATVETASEVSGTVEMMLGTATLVGTVLRSGDYGGRYRARIVGGYGGWRSPVSARGYQLEFGIQLAVVLSDLARDAGETLAGTVPVRSIGNRYARPALAGSTLADVLLPEGWYVDWDGTTHVGARPSSVAVASLVEPGWDSAAMVAHVSTESPETVVPGARIEQGTIGTVEIAIAKDIRARCWVVGSPAADAGGVFGQAVHRAMGAARYAGVWEYRIADSTSSGLCTVEPVSSASGMPPLANVRPRLLAGIRVLPNVGTTCLIAFADRDLAKPVIVGYCPSDSPEWPADTIEIEAGDVSIDADVDIAPALGLAAPRQVVRVGDTITVGTASGAVILTAPVGGTHTRLKA